MLDPRPVVNDFHYHPGKVVGHAILLPGLVTADSVLAALRHPDNCLGSSLARIQCYPALLTPAVRGPGPQRGHGAAA